MAPHETFGGQTVAPTNPGMWQGPEVRNICLAPYIWSHYNNLLIPSVNFPQPPYIYPLQFYSKRTPPYKIPQPHTVTLLPLQLVTGEDMSRPESDVYSYGMVVWHLFSRNLPFDGKRMTDPQVMKLTVINKKVGGGLCVAHARLALLCVCGN